MKRPEILPRLPSIYHDGEAIPDDIANSHLIQIGSTEDGDGLVIKYIPKDQQTERQLVLFYDGRGVWITKHV